MQEPDTMTTAPFPFGAHSGAAPVDAQRPALSTPTSATESPLGVLDALGSMCDEMHTMLIVAQYVASSFSVLDAINQRATYCPDFAATMHSVHPTWRDPDSHGETMGALAHFLGMARGRLDAGCGAIEQQYRTAARSRTA